MRRPGVAEHSVHAGRAGRNNVGIEHHERKPAVTLKRILVVKLDDRLLFPIFEPPVAGNPSVVFVDFAVALPPVVELAQA